MTDFWTLRKADARAVEAAEAEAAAQAEAERAAQAEAAELDALPEAELLERLGLPDPDAVVSGDDVVAFMARAVPRHIRNRALRSLWRSNPVLANLDGLNDYDGDYTGDGLGGGVLRTSYEVGKGLAAHVKRMAELSDEKYVPDLPDENAREYSPQPVDKISLADATPDVEPCPEGPAPEEAQVPVTITAAPPRRMRFTFEEGPQE